MPCLALMYMLPFLVAFSLSLYPLMTSSGISLNLIQMNSAQCRGVMRWKFEISIVMNRAPFMEMTLMNSILATSISAVVGGYFAGVVDSVSACRESHLVGFCLFGSDRAYKLPVRDIFPAVCRYLVLGDELDSVGGVFDAPIDAICQSPEFIGC
jgi:hypothetical protein